MTMRILDNAGLSIATDKVREPDTDNPKGYFEIDNVVNKLKYDPNMVFDYEGKVLKVIHYGLKHLPEGDYKIVYIDRDLDEVMASMEKMMSQDDPDQKATKAAFAKLDLKVKALIESRQDMNVLYINHRDLVTDPGPTIDQIIEFLDIDSSKRQTMIDAIDRKLYRNKAN